MNVKVVLHIFVNYITMSSLSRASLVVTLLYVIIFTMHQSHSLQAFTSFTIPTPAIRADRHRHTSSPLSFPLPGTM
jgi:hypothetical protein